MQNNNIIMILVRGGGEGTLKKTLLLRNRGPGRVQKMTPFPVLFITWMGSIHARECGDRDLHEKKKDTIKPHL